MLIFIKLLRISNLILLDFGKYAKKYYSTIDEWQKSDWLSNYQNAFFEVTVNTTVKGSYLFNKM